MIEKFEDLDLKHEDEMETIEQKVQEKLGVSVPEMRQLLSNYVVEHAEELTHEFANIAPLGDYSQLMEDNDSMSKFLKTEGHKPEHWLLHSVRQHDTQPALIVFDFRNKAVDDGENFEGFVFVSKAGKVRHAFAQGDK